MENEATKILAERRKTLQQMIDAKVGEAFDEGELFQAELKQKLSEIEMALNLISQNPLVKKSLPSNEAIADILIRQYGDGAEEGVEAIREWLCAWQAGNLL